MTIEQAAKELARLRDFMLSKYPPSPRLETVVEAINTVLQNIEAEPCKS